MILRRKRLQRSSVPKRGGPLKRGKGVRRKKAVKRVSAKRRGVIAADAEWARKVREEYGDRCFHFWCASPPTDTHHIIGKKAHPRLRYDVENGLPMCRAHHQEAHRRVRWFKENFAGWYGDRWARLQAKASRESRLLA